MVPSKNQKKNNIQQQFQQQYYCVIILSYNLEFILFLMKTIQLQFPQINQKTITAFYAQARPYRKNGFRLQTQTYENKFIFHNYGHGGSGVSMSYGCSLQIKNIFKKLLLQLPKNIQNQCAVLGSGILGLMTALLLVEDGQKVKIYAQKIPSFGQKNNDKMITSEVAPGFWFPYDYIDFQPELSQRIRKNSYEYLSNCIKTNKYKGLKFAMVYQDLYSANDHQLLLQQQSKKKYEKVQLKFKNGQKKIVNKYQSIRLDMQLFLYELICQLKSKGVQFKETTIKNKKQLLDYKQKYIFNCLGNGVKYIFGDDEAEHIVGHLVQIKNTNPQKFNYIFATKVKDDKVMIFCHQSRILIGHTRHHHNNTKVNKQIIAEIIQKANAYMRPKNMINSKL